MKLSSLCKAAFFILMPLILAYSPSSLADSHDQKAWSEAGNGKMFTIFMANLTQANEEVLSGNKVNPQTPKNARGFFMGAYNNQTHMLSFMIGYIDLSQGGVAMSHFHFKCSGDGEEPSICEPGKASGPIIQTICGKPTRPGMVPDWPATKDDKGEHGLEEKCSEGTNGFIKGKWLVQEPYRKGLFDGKVFVNLHTKLNPKGEVSGLLEKKQ